MLGAIIGDLAASTWSTNRPAFYKQLIAENVGLTPYGDSALRFGVALINGDSIGGAPCGFDWDTRARFATVLAALGGWMYDDVEEGIKGCLRNFGTYLPEKEGWYAVNLLVPLVIGLRQGLSKDAAVKLIPNDLGDMLFTWEKNKSVMLGAIARAWDSFYRWYDFTSIIHSAVKSPIEPNLTSIVAGSLAQAAYGCRYGFIKKKYSEDTQFFIHIPIQDCRIQKLADYDISVRKFFPKNNAMTNVEKHQWRDVPNPYANILFSEHVYKKIKLALETGWENRYGIYLDNGWFYVYRSFFLLSRFMIAREGNKYRIVKLQMSNDFHSVPTDYLGIEDALYSIQLPPYRKETREEDYVVKSIYGLFSLYRGELEDPYANDYKRYSRIWHGEKMFNETMQDIDYWREHAKAFRASRIGSKKKNIEHLSDEQLGIRLFIEELYRKWCPMEKDFTWIFKKYDIVNNN